MRKNEVTIKVEYVGIETADINLWARRLATSTANTIRLGHEASGTIQQVGQYVNNFKIGENVVIEYGLPCKRCDYCKTGSFNLCENIVFGHWNEKNCLMQTFAQDADFVHKLPDSIQLQQGPLIGLLARAVHSCKKGNVSVHTKVLILGANALGLAIILVAKAYAAPEVLAIDSSETRLQTAQELGATHILRISKKDVPNIEETIHGLIDDRPDVSFYCNTEIKAFGQVAVLATKKKGLIIVCGLQGEKPKIPLSEALRKEIEIVGSFRYCNDHSDAIKLIEGKQWNLSSTMGQQFQIRTFADVPPPDNGDESPVAAATDGKTIKEAEKLPVEVATAEEQKKKGAQIREGNAIKPADSHHISPDSNSSLQAGKARTKMAESRKPARDENAIKPQPDCQYISLHSGSSLQVVGKQDTSASPTTIPQWLTNDQSSSGISMTSADRFNKPFKHVVDSPKNFNDAQLLSRLPRNYVKDPNVQRSRMVADAVFPAHEKTFLNASTSPMSLPSRTEPRSGLDDDQASLKSILKSAKTPNEEQTQIDIPRSRAIPPGSPRSRSLAKSSLKDQGTAPMIPDRSSRESLSLVYRVEPKKEKDRFGKKRNRTGKCVPGRPCSKANMMESCEELNELSDGTEAIVPEGKKCGCKNQCGHSI